jgi:DNA polymerase III alpha subunit
VRREADSLTAVRIDLHTHSNRSDGTDTPAELVRRAAALGLDVVALTDHDSAEGWHEAHTAAQATGIRLVPGSRSPAALLAPACTSSGTCSTPPTPRWRPS